MDHATTVSAETRRTDRVGDRGTPEVEGQVKGPSAHMAQSRANNLKTSRNVMKPWNAGTTGSGLRPGGAIAPGFVQAQ